MKKPRAAILLILCGIVSLAASNPATTVLDTGADVKLFDTFFGRFGTHPSSVVIRESNGIRLHLPAEPKGAKPTGLYSYFALAGDFEVSASYEAINLPPPTAGYGVGFGLAVETKGPDGDVTVRRGVWDKEGAGLQVVRGKPDAAGVMKYEAKFFPVPAKSGRVILRREKANLLVLSAADYLDEPRELIKVPFTTKTVRTLLVFADSGGSATVVDGRFTDLTVRAAEITGGIPKRDRDRTPIWVIVLAIVLAISIGGGLWWFLSRRKRKLSVTPS
jgi:hypothetical protein